MARINAARDIFAALPGIWTRSLAEELLAPKTACTPAQPSRPIVAISNDTAVRINRHHRDYTAVGEKYMVERTVSVGENLLALAANLFELRHKLLEIAGWQGE
ncbi:MAG TPA: hypothetical protein VII23_05815 [Terriglobales bacterium]